MPDSAVYLTTVHDDGESIAISAPIAVATGIRNTSAMVFDPATGDLWIGENGIDGFEDPFVSFSADELNVVPADAIGVQTDRFRVPGHVHPLRYRRSGWRDRGAALHGLPAVGWLGE